MKRNQLFLEQYSLKKNKEFFNEMFNSSSLVNCNKWFDIKNSRDLRRKFDETMTFDIFLDLMKRPYYIRLQMGSPDFERIRYMVNLHGDRKYEGLTRFAFLECPFVERNYLVVSDLFKNIFGKDIESFELPAGLEDYHRRYLK
jgi:hypothetical protein